MRGADWVKMLTYATGALAVGCGAAQSEPSVPRTGGGHRLHGATTIPMKAAVIVERSVAEARDLAVAELEVRMAEQLLGPKWVPELKRTPFSGTNWSTWLAENQVVQQSPPRGFVAQLNASQVERALNEFGKHEWAVDARLPTSWQPTLRAALAAERQWAICQSKQRWLGAECTLPAPIDERLAVANLLADLEVTPLLREGIPVRPDGELVWPVAVQVKQGLADISGVPLRLIKSGEVEVAAHGFAAQSDVVVSDERGVCLFPLTRLEPGTQVGVVLTQLLGPLAELAPVAPLGVVTRELELRRLTVLEIANQDRGAVALSQPSLSQPSAPFQTGAPSQTNALPQTGALSHAGAPGPGPALQRGLAATFGAPTLTLPSELEYELQQATLASSVNREAMGAGLRERFVAATHGTVDYLVLTWGHSEFASQMGEGRTWYEARAGVKVVEVWSGVVVAQFEESANGAGIGDAAAQQAAFEAAARLLATRLRKTLMP